MGNEQKLYSVSWRVKPGLTYTRIGSTVVYDHTNSGVWFSDDYEKALEYARNQSKTFLLLDYFVSVVRTKVSSVQPAIQTNIEVM